MSVMKAKEIMEVIPHRQPMLLIDTIEELTPGEHGIGKKCVSYNEPYFAGHFPQEPVMPGVLMIEALAQVGAVVMLSCPEYKGKTAYFGAINQAKFKRKSGSGGCPDAGSGNDQEERVRSGSEKPWQRLKGK